jgi:hypothetical protein
VRWSDHKAKALADRDLEMVATVGDCRQFPVALSPRGSVGGGSGGRGDQANVRSFRVPLVLIGTNNRIQLEVPSVGQQESSRREFQLTCAAPAKNQRLHVLIVGVNVPDSAGLKKRVLDALGVAAGDQPVGAQGEFFKKPPFERCVLYHVLAGEVDRGKVEGQLVEINNEIRRLQRTTGWLNDLVLIYYQGEDIEIPAKKERWLKTSRNFQFPKTPAPVFAIPCHALPRVPGAQILLLNVAGTADARLAGLDWGGDSHTGFMRYACRDRTELLGLMQEAIRKKSRLDDVVQYVNDLFARQAQRISPVVVLNADQKGRQIGEPNR